MKEKNCPFYGRHLYFANHGPTLGFILLDSKGNQCALVNYSYAPCRMEADGQKVEWSECPLMRDIRLEASV